MVTKIKYSIGELIGKISILIEEANVHYWSCNIVSCFLENNTNSNMLIFAFIFRCENNSLVKGSFGWHLSDPFDITSVNLRIKAAIIMMEDEIKEKKLTKIKNPRRFERLDWGSVYER